MDTWSIDFMGGLLRNGRKVRVLYTIDDFNREMIWQEVQCFTSQVGPFDLILSRPL